MKNKLERLEQAQKIRKLTSQKTILEDEREAINDRARFLDKAIERISRDIEAIEL